MFGTTSSQKIKVGVLKQYPYCFAEDKDSTNIDEYQGIYIDVWRKLVDTHLADYEFEYVFIDGSKDNIKTHIEDTEKGVYDVLLGGIFVDKKNTDKVFYTRNILLNKKSFAYYSGFQDRLSLFGKSIMNVVLPTLAIGVIVYILAVFVFLMYKRTSFKYSFYDSLWYVVTTFLKDPGQLVMTPFKGKNIYSKAIPLLFIVLFIAFFFNVLLHAITTTTYISARVGGDPFILENELNKRRVVVKKGDSIKWFLLSQNIDVIETEDVPWSYFMENKDERNIDGIVDDIHSLDFIQKNVSGARISSRSLGYEEMAFVTSKRNSILLKKINIGLAEMKRDRHVFNSCNKYIPENSYLCEL